MGKVTVTIETLSPLHLGSGQENIIVDSDVVYDQYGMPYFPAKRFRGALYESALELAEMSAGREALTVDNINTFFGLDTSSENALRISNFYLTDEGESYESLCKQWKYLQHEYSGLLTPEDVLSVYTTMRYYTSIHPENGVALHGSLHTMRVVKKGTVFQGTIEWDRDVFDLPSVDVACSKDTGKKEKKSHQKLSYRKKTYRKKAAKSQMKNRTEEIIELMLANLRFVGTKRNRGLGAIRCEIK